jgi:hypothetical protein
MTETLPESPLLLLAQAVRDEHAARISGATAQQAEAMQRIRDLRALVLLRAHDDHLAEAIEQLTGGEGK